MLLDLNDYYPAVNLVVLYREHGDHDLADEAHVVTAAACRAAIAFDRAPEWAVATQLNLAFDRGDVDEARRLQHQLELQGMPVWQIQTTRDDLAILAARHPNDVRVQLEQILRKP